MVSAPELAVTGGNVLAGTWQHLAMEIGRDDLSLYVDGARYSGRSKAWSLVGTGTGVVFVVGGVEGMTATPFIGLVDNLRLRTGRIYQGNFTPSRQMVKAGKSALAFSFRAEDVGATRLKNEGWLPLQASLQDSARVFQLLP